MVGFASSAHPMALAATPERGNQQKLGHHTGRDCRYPVAMEGRLDSPPCVLDTGNPCRNDVVFLNLMVVTRSVGTIKNWYGGCALLSFTETSGAIFVPKDHSLQTIVCILRIHTLLFQTQISMSIDLHRHSISLPLVSTLG